MVTITKFYMFRLGSATLTSFQRHRSENVNGLYFSRFDFGSVKHLHILSSRSKAGVVVTMKKDDGTPRVVLRTQPFATPEKVHDVAMETYRNIKTRLHSLQRSMALYLANRDTEAILFRPIKVGHQTVMAFFFFLFFFGGGGGLGGN